MSSVLSINVRALLICTFTALAIAWFIFLILEFPWIVPADSDLGSDQERVAYAGGKLFLLSLVAVWLPTGIFGRGRLQLSLSILLFTFCLFCGCFLYPSNTVWHYPIRLIMHLGECALLGYLVIRYWQNIKT